MQGNVSQIFFHLRPGLNFMTIKTGRFGNILQKLFSIHGQIPRNGLTWGPVRNSGGQIITLIF